MTEEVREKLKIIYDDMTEKARNIIEVFEHQFGRELVDNSLLTFDDFLQKLSTETLGSLGIYKLSDTNDFGSYTIDKDDYEANGKDKNFLEYIPDLGIIDYLSFSLIRFLKKSVRETFSNSRSVEAFYITIKFPEVTVTNEYDKSIVIQDLFVRVPVTLSGKTFEKFRMARTTYPVDQWLSDYAHSHLSGVQTDFDFPCTGRGPVNNTISTLCNRYDIQVWGLYSFEIAKYVTVESIAGTPYRRLENVGSIGSSIVDTSRLKYKGMLRNYTVYSLQDMRKFVEDFLRKGKIKFAFRNENFTIGEDLFDIWLRMSNHFIEWHNNNLKLGIKYTTEETLINYGIINKYIVANNRAYRKDISARFSRLLNDEGKELFMFKGKMQKLHFLGSTSNTNEVILIDIMIVYFALTKALEIINYRYGREKSNKEGISTDSRTLYF